MLLAVIFCNASNLVLRLLVQMQCWSGLMPDVASLRSHCLQPSWQRTALQRLVIASKVQICGQDSLCCVQIGLEMLVSHPGNDPTTWAVTQIFYNGQLYQNTTQLNTAFADTTSGLNRQQVTFIILGKPLLNEPGHTLCVSQHLQQHLLILAACASSQLRISSKALQVQKAATLGNCCPSP